jgi:thiamine biosynthesis lipoprotein
MSTTIDTADSSALAPVVNPFRPTGIAARDLTVMGGRGHLVVYAEDELGHELLDRGEARLRELESRWSRFVATSDITRANLAAGTEVTVHPDTIAVVSRALEGWRQTGGRFDATTLPALVDQGYTQSALSAAAAPLVPGRRIGTSAWVMVDTARSTITLPAGSAIDLGGIGKGFAADLVADELVAAGAAGVLVNLGGDLSVRGVPNDDTSWYLGIEDPTARPKHLALLRVAVGGIATSGTTIRRWSTDGEARHHLIDPTTSRPAATGVMTATVLAADAATAEVFATAAMLLSPPDAATMLDGADLAGLVVGDDGSVHRSATLGAFLA